MAAMWKVCHNRKENTMKNVIGTILLAAGILTAAPNSQQRMAQDYQQGIISLDDYVYYLAAGITKQELVPQQYLVEKPNRNATMDLKFIHENSRDLSDETREKLIQLGFTFKYGAAVLLRPTNLTSSYTAGIFKFHYTTGGDDAVAITDSDLDGTPDYVETMAEVFVEVYNKQCGTSSGQMGFVRPPSDNYYSSDNGGDGQYDVYIFNLESGMYGWVSLEAEASGNYDNEFSTSVIEPDAFTSFMGMRNNYTDFTSSTELGNVQVTTAHELFHAIQMGYDGLEKSWLMEATATWMEDEIYDDINDNYGYLTNWFYYPNLALNYDHTAEDDSVAADPYGYDTHWYGSWIFIRYISEHMKPASGNGFETIRNIWDKSVVHDSYYGDYSITAVDEGLKAANTGYSFKSALYGMALANAMLTATGDYSYSEVEGYKAAVYEGEVFYQDKAYDFLNTKEYIYDYTGGKLMRYAAHYIKLWDPAPRISVKFTQYTSTTSFQVGSIAYVQGTPTVYPVSIGTSTSLSFGSTPDSVIFAVVVVDSSTVSDNYYNLKISFPNQAPTLTEITSTLSTDEETELRVAFKGEDIDDDDLTYTYTSDTSGVAVAHNTAMDSLILTPAVDFFGYALITVTVSDGFLSDTSSFTLAVGNVNDPPELAIVQDQTVDEDNFITVKLTATNPAGNALTFSGFADTTAITVTADNDTLKLVPQANWNGSSIITAIASNGVTSDSTTFILTVTAVNDAPSSFNLVSPANNSTIEIIDTNFQDTLTFSWDSSTDMENDPISYAFIGTEELSFLSFSGGSHSKVKVALADIYAVIDQSGLPQWTDPSKISGTWSVLATDGEDSTAASNGPFTLTISEIVLTVDGKTLIPDVYTLHQNYPNPFNPVTTINYDLPEQSQVTLTIHNILGREIRKLVNTIQETGYKSIIWDGTDEFGRSVGTGIYLYQIKAGDFVQTKKMVLMK